MLNTAIRTRQSKARGPSRDGTRHAGWLKMMHAVVCCGVWTFRSCVGSCGVVTAASAGQRILGEERKQDLGEINTPPVIIAGVARPAGRPWNPSRHSDQEPFIARRRPGRSLPSARAETPDMQTLMTTASNTNTADTSGERIREQSSVIVLVGLQCVRPPGLSR